jgi:hypothetical protein
MVLFTSLDNGYGFTIRVLLVIAGVEIVNNRVLKLCNEIYLVSLDWGIFSTGR